MLDLLRSQRIEEILFFLFFNPVSGLVLNSSVYWSHFSFLRALFGLLAHSLARSS
jgi:hypothetical protein